MLAPRGSLTLAFPLLATALAADEAEACPMPYACGDTWSGLHLRTTQIPIDGVLVLEGTRFGDGDSLADVTLEITKDGQPIAGALETTAYRDALIWRPAAPWQPGVHTAAGIAGNPGSYLEYCGLENEEFGGDITVLPDPGGAPGTPEFAGVPAQSVEYKLGLDKLACCVGADPPSADANYCGGYYFDFDPAQCGPTESVGYFVLELAADPVADEPLAGQILYTYKLDDGTRTSSFEPSAELFHLTKPVCITLEAQGLGTGEITISAEKCFGQDFAAELGDQTSLPDLDCPLEKCAVIDKKDWDTTNCTPLTPNPDSDSDTPTSGDTDVPTTGDTDASEASTAPDPEESGDKGCACTEAAPSAPLLAVPLVLLARRRRR